MYQSIADGPIGEMRRIGNEVGLQPGRALLRRSQGSASVMRFSYQAESSRGDPAASGHRDVVLRAALPAAELRANVDFGVLIPRTGAAEAHSLAQRAASVARTFIRAASPHRYG